MDAMPVSLGQELSGWAAQLQSALYHLERTLPEIQQLAIGGTAVGTGINADAAFGRLVAEQLSKTTGLSFRVAENRFAALSSQDAAVALSGQLKTLATALMKISNDLRWMNSGPLAGIGEGSAVRKSRQAICQHFSPGTIVGPSQPSENRGHDDEEDVIEEKKEEDVIEAVIEKELGIDQFCGDCQFGGMKFTCDTRVSWMVKTYGITEDAAKMSALQFCHKRRLRGY